MKNKFLDALRARLAEVDTEITASLDARQAVTDKMADETRTAPTEDEQKVLDEHRTKLSALDADKAALDSQIADAEADEKRRSNITVPNVIPSHEDEPVDGSGLRKLSRNERRNRAMRILDGEDRSAAVGLDSTQKDAVERLLNTPARAGYDPDHVAVRMIVTETPDYHSAFTKVIAAGLSGRGAMLDADEMRAMQVFDEVRAAAGQVDTAGGYGVPVLIDPTMIFTSQGHNAVILRHCDIKTITTDAWKGVSTAGMSGSFDDEAAEVSDDTMTLGQPSIPVWTWRGFLPYSVEVGMDYPGLVGEFNTAIDMAWNDDLALYTATGSGSSQPTGWQTKLDATTTSEVTVTTDGGFAVQDISKVWKNVPERFRANAVWFMHTDVGEAIAAFGATYGSSFTTDLSGTVDMIRKRPVEYSDYLQTYVSGSTGALNLCSVGDPRGYSFVRRLGMTVEAVPHLFGTSNAGRPKLQRGILAYARVGADFTNTNAVRLLQNQ